MKGYFVVYLNNGYRFDFERQCNQVGYSDNKVMVFKHVDKEANTERVLAIIPYVNILYVRNWLKEEEGE